MAIVNYFRGDNKALEILQKPHHKARVIVTGWGEPPTYYSECSCGWRGHVIESLVPEALIKPLQEFGQLHGWEALLKEDSLYGDGDDAAREVLEHLTLPLDAMIQERHETVKNLAQELSTIAAWNPEKAKNLATISDEITILLEVLQFLKDQPTLPHRETPFSPKLQAETQQIIKVYYE